MPPAWADAQGTPARQVLPPAVSSALTRSAVRGWVTLRRRRSTKPMPPRAGSHQAALLSFEEAIRQLQPLTGSPKAKPVPAAAVPLLPPLEVAIAPPVPGLPVLPPLPVVVVVPPLPKAPPLAGLAPPMPWP